MSSQPQYQGSINYNYVSTPTIVNNFVGSVLWYDALFGVQDFSKTTALMPEAIAIGDGGANDLADFANRKLNFLGTNLGSNFTQSFPLDGALHFRVPSIDFYLSDEWAVTKNLKLTFGMRFEKDINPTCDEKCFVLTNVPFNSSSYSGGATVPYGTTITKDSDLFYKAESIIPQPRVRLAWKPFGHGKTVIRGGVRRKTQQTFSLLVFRLDLRSQLKVAVAPASFSTPSITTSPATYTAPKDIEWSFEIEQQITNHNVFTVSYVGDHGYDLAETVNANMYTSAAGANRYGGGFSGLPTASPDPRFVSVTQYYNNGISN